MYLLDTNICIYLMKNSFPDLTAQVLSHAPEEFAISSVTVFELEYGAAKSQWGEKTHQKLTLFLAPFTILPFDATDALTAGRIRAILKSLGNPIGPYDLLIGSQALARKLTVITHNTSEFGRIPDLSVEDWVSSD